MNFDPITYNEARQLRAHFLLLNGSPEALQTLLDPAVTPASFASWLGTSGKPALFEQLIAAPAGVAAVAASSTAMAAVAASSTAMAAVAASSTAMVAVAASSTAMAAVAASSTAMAAVIASSTAMAAVAASSTAMVAVAASSTAMAAVAASSTAMAAVAASSTAMAAVAASSTAMAAVIASSTAMAAVIASSTAMAAIFADSAAKAAFKGSTALAAVAIPTMTSDTAPSGTAAVSTNQSASFAAWKALDKSAGSSWLSANGQTSNQWLRYDFPAAVFIHTATIQGGASGGGNTKPNSFRIEYSDDGSAWTQLTAQTHTNDTTVRTYDVVAAGKHRYWRLFVVTNHGGTYVEVAEFTLEGFTW